MSQFEPPAYLRDMKVFKFGFIWGNEKNCFQNGGMNLKKGGWHVLSIMYYLTTDTLVDLYLLAVLKLPVRAHCRTCRKLMPFEDELDICVINHCYAKTFFGLCILFNTLLKYPLFKLQFSMQVLLLLAISPGSRVRGGWLLHQSNWLWN